MLLEKLSTPKVIYNNNKNLFCLNTGIWNIGINQWCNEKANVLSETVYTEITNLHNHEKSTKQNNT